MLNLIKQRAVVGAALQFPTDLHVVDVDVCLQPWVDLGLWWRRRLALLGGGLNHWVSIRSKNSIARITAKHGSARATTAAVAAQEVKVISTEAPRWFRAGDPRT